MRAIEPNRDRSHLRGLVVLAVLFLHATPALAALNPSAVYCDSLGYEYLQARIEKGMIGICKLPDGTMVDAWKFFLGEVALEHSYCAREGYEAKHVEDPAVCLGCTVCVLPGGEEKPVAHLMELSDAESRCGDGACGTAENFSNCPGDCASGLHDDYCDGMADGTCDRDCLARGEADPDCDEPIPNGGSGCGCATGPHAPGGRSAGLVLIVGLAIAARRAGRSRGRHA